MSTLTMDQVRPMDAASMLGAIRPMDLLATSGGRWQVCRAPSRDDDEPLAYYVDLPCGNGYRVRVSLDPSDTYRVQRIFRRSGREWVKGEATDVYVEQLSETVYRAGCFRDSWPAGGIG